jgi:hypothetical protein
MFGLLCLQQLYVFHIQVAEKVRGNVVRGIQHVSTRVLNYMASAGVPETSDIRYTCTSAPLDWQGRAIIKLWCISDGSSTI